MGFGQQGQSRNPLGFESVGDQVEEGGTCTLRCCSDGVPQEDFVVELGAVAAIKLKDAVFPDRFGNLVRQGRGCGGSSRGLGPSRVRVEAGQGLGHRIRPNKLPTIRCQLGD